MHFLEKGAEFYIAGRIIYYKRCLNVAPLLFHHALEFFMKAVLADFYTLNEMKSSKFRHDLVKLWRDIKKRNSISENTLDKFIAKFNQIGKTEYPENNGSHCIPHSFSPQKGSAPTTLGLQGRGMQFMTWSLEEIDELIAFICNYINAQPNAKAFVLMLASVTKDDAFFKDNQHFIKE